MTIWETYPNDYRQREVKRIVAAAHAGECASLLGLSGAGKSNLMGYIANTQSSVAHAFVLVDVNRLTQRTPSTFFILMRQSLADSDPASDDLASLHRAVEQRLKSCEHLTFLLDLSLMLNRGVMFGEGDQLFFNNLRALRDSFKFHLTYVTATRHPLPLNNEFAELFHANVIWLALLSESDSIWNVRRHAERKGLKWDDAVAKKLFELSLGYPSFLRAACEAYSSDVPFESIPHHPSVASRLKEFWDDQPSDDELRLSGLANHPWLKKIAAYSFDISKLTAKENVLLDYFISRADQLCEKDDLIRAVWAEDKMFERGVRDDSLAQLIRRLREKIEPDPAAPKHIHTVSGRGYRFTQ